MAKASVPPIPHDVHGVSALLASPEIAALISDLEATRWTGRPGYPIRAMVAIALVKSLYRLPTWTRAVSLVREHAELRRVLGAAPSVSACYRFTVKLREKGDALAYCIASVLARLAETNPEMGKAVAIDGSDLPAYANGQRYLSAKSRKPRERFSDPDASWGGTGPRSRPARVAGSTATRSTRSWTWRRSCRSRGRSSRRVTRSARWYPTCWTS